MAFFAMLDNSFIDNEQQAGGITPPVGDVARALAALYPTRHPPHCREGFGRETGAGGRPFMPCTYPPAYTLHAATCIRVCSVVMWVRGAARAVLRLTDIVRACHAYLHHLHYQRALHLGR